jgi:hypothetical protein
MGQYETMDGKYWQQMGELLIQHKKATQQVMRKQMGRRNGRDDAGNWQIGIDTMEMLSIPIFYGMRGVE